MFRCKISLSCPYLCVCACPPTTGVSSPPADRTCSSELFKGCDFDFGVTCFRICPRFAKHAHAQVRRPSQALERRRERPERRHTQDHSLTHGDYSCPPLHSLWSVWVSRPLPLSAAGSCMHMPLPPTHCKERDLSRRAQTRHMPHSMCCSRYSV